MTSEYLLDVIGEIDDRYIAEAVLSPAKKKNSIKWIASACAAVLIVAIVATAVFFGRDFLPQSSPENGYGTLTNEKTETTKKYIKKYGAKPEDEFSASMPNMRPHWDEMMDCQRYISLNYNNNEYSTKLLATHAENIGDRLGTAELTGQDICYTGEIHKRTAEIYSIVGISTEAAVCVKFNETDQYAYAYANGRYTPATLGEFIDALSLKKNLTTGLVIHKTENPEIVYEDIPTELVWKMLLSDTSIKNQPDIETGKVIMSISASVNIIGYHYKSISLTEDGYLTTNILESGKAFYIGRDRIDEFVKEVTENHQGYIYIYDTLTGDEEVYN